jgi:hypothetical protein
MGLVFFSGRNKVKGQSSYHFLEVEEQAALGTQLEARKRS